MEKLKTIKNLYYLFGAGLLLFVLSYQLAIKKTIGAWKVNHELQVQLAQGAVLAYQPGYLQRRNNNLEEAISRFKADTAEFRNAILSNLSLLAEKENAKLVEVPRQNPFYHTAGFILQKLVFEGTYFSLVKILQELQITHDSGAIRTVIIKKPVNRGLADNNLPRMEVYFEIAK